MTRQFTPIEKINVTIVATWLAIVAIATIVLFTSAERWTGTKFNGLEADGTPKPYVAVHHVSYHVAGYVTALVVATVLTVVALGIAYVWAGRRQAK